MNDPNAGLVVDANSPTRISPLVSTPAAASEATREEIEDLLEETDGLPLDSVAKLLLSRFTITRKDQV